MWRSGRLFCTHLAPCTERTAGHCGCGARGRAELARARESKWCFQVQTRAPCPSYAHVCTHTGLATKQELSSRLWCGRVSRRSSAPRQHYGTQEGEVALPLPVLYPSLVPLGLTIDALLEGRGEGRALATAFRVPVLHHVARGAALDAQPLL